MPPTPGIRYYKSRRAYYTECQGKQHRLAVGPRDEPNGPTYLAATKKFAEVMSARVEPPGKADDGFTVADVVARYYKMLDGQGRAATLHQARTLLDPALVDLGAVKVPDLKPYMVREWLDRMSQWNSSTQHTAIGRLSRSLYWAKEEGLIPANPIAEMSKPEKLTRGKEVIIPEGLQDVLIASANPAFAKVLRVLRGTGCRPGEVMNARVHNYKPALGALVFSWNATDYRWKNARKTKRDRVIYLPEELQAMVEGEVRGKAGDEFIFLTARGLPWTSNNMVNRLDGLLRHRAVVAWREANDFDTDRTMAYSFRHSFITRMLLAGCPIKVLADLCGTSVNMIERNYSKAADDHQAMRRLFLDFNRRAADVAPPSPRPPA